jgi:hypothetical protein
MASDPAYPLPAGYPIRKFISVDNSGLAGALNTLISDVNVAIPLGGGGSWAQILRRTASGAGFSNLGRYTRPRLSQTPLQGSVPWVTAVAYVAGNIVSNAGNCYIATNSGTSGATAPTGFGTAISDGTVSWNYAGPQTAPVIHQNILFTSYPLLTNSTIAHSASPLTNVPWRIIGGTPFLFGTSNFNYVSFGAGQHSFAGQANGFNQNVQTSVSLTSATPAAITWPPSVVPYTGMPFYFQSNTVPLTGVNSVTPYYCAGVSGQTSNFSTSNTGSPLVNTTGAGPVICNVQIYGSNSPGSAIEFEYDGTMLGIQTYALGSELNVRVDGQYIDSYITQNTATGQHVIDFTNTVFGAQFSCDSSVVAGRVRRTLTVEINMKNSPLYAVYYGANDSLVPSYRAENWAFGFIGDSQWNGSFNTAGGMSGVIPMVGELLGVPEVANVSYTGRGFVWPPNNQYIPGGTVAGPAYGAWDLTDLQNYGMPIKALAIQCSSNDTASTAAATGAAAALFFAQARAAFPGIPIFVVGIFVGGTVMTQAVLAPYETAIFAAVTAMQNAGDQLIFTIPNATATTPVVTGTGSGGSGTGTGKYDVGGDNLHMTSAGQQAYARWLAGNILTIANMFI